MQNIRINELIDPPKEKNLWLRLGKRKSRNKSVGGAKVTVLLIRLTSLSLVKNWIKKVFLRVCDLELWVVSTIALPDLVVPLYFW